MRESLTLTVLENGNLLLAAGNECRAAIRDMQERGLSDILILSDLTEPYWTNGSFEPFDAGMANPFVGLTDAPCIAEAMDVHDDGRKEIVSTTIPDAEGRFWYYAPYMLRSPVDELKRRGRVIFSKA